MTIEIAGKMCLDDVTLTDDIAEGISEVSLRETADDSGVFEGTFEVPAACGAHIDDRRKHICRIH